MLQPLYAAAGTTLAHDVAVHAFYPVPAAQLAPVIAELRDLARIQGTPPGAALGVSAAARAGNPAYLGRLRVLVLRYARGDQLVRVTVIGQIAGSAAFAWIFRGLDRTGDALVPIAIPGIAGAQQSALLAGGDAIYNVDRVADAPAGFALALNGVRFAAAAPDQRTAAVAALIALQNPLLHDTNDLQCLACHVATPLTARRARATGVSPATLPGYFASPRALAVDTIASRDPRVVRAFGWAGQQPAISQRVVNETAAVLSELEARFPPR